METKIFDLKKDTKRILVIIIAALLMAVNIKTFVQAGNLLPGGATGLTLLIQRAVKLFFDLDIPYSPINILLNAIPAFIGFKFIGKKFTIYSCLMILLVGLFADLIPAFVKNGFKYAESNPELADNTAVQLQWQYFDYRQHRRRQAFKKEI